MDYKKAINRNCIILFTIMAIVCVLCIPTPSSAHVLNKATLSVQLNQPEELPMVYSDFLIEEGQKILLHEGFTELLIPITVSGGDGVATVTAESDHPDRLQATVDTEKIELTEGTNTFYLTLKMIEPEDDDKGSVSDSDAVSGTVSDNDAVSGTVSENDAVSGTVSENDAVSGTVSDNDAASETVSDNDAVSGTVSDNDAASETVSENDAVSRTVSDSDGMSETVSCNNVLSGTVSGNEAESETTLDEKFPVSGNDVMPETDESISMVSAKITLTYGSLTLWAEIVIELDETLDIVASAAEKATTFSTTVIPESAGEAAEELTKESTEASVDESIEESVSDSDAESIYCQSQYHPTEMVRIVNSTESDQILGIFPAMTKYIIDEKSYLLFQGGSIQIPAGKELQVDLSLTDVKDDLYLTADTGNLYTIKYAELPVMSQDCYPLIISEVSTSIPIQAMWGNIEPEVCIEHLAVMENTEENSEEEKTLDWIATDKINTGMDVEGNLRLYRSNPEAGTYRMTVLWKEDENTLYEMQILFFIQYESGAQGGIGL